MLIERGITDRLRHAVLDAGLRARQHIEPSQVYEVDFRRFVEDPLGEIERIYHHFGFELSSETANAMHRWHAARPRGHRGEHRYAAADFGLDDDDIRDRFADYRERFDVRQGRRRATRAGARRFGGKRS